MSRLTPMPEYISQIEFLRDLVAAFNSCREDAIDGFSIEELVNIYRCWFQCGWDYHLNKWTLQQVREASRGICPDWDDNGKPVYAPDRRTARRVKHVTIKLREAADA